MKAPWEGLFKCKLYFLSMSKKLKEGEVGRKFHLKQNKVPGWSTIYTRSNHPFSFGEEKCDIAARDGVQSAFSASWGVLLFSHRWLRNDCSMSSSFQLSKWLTCFFILLRYFTIVQLEKLWENIYHLLCSFIQQIFTMHLEKCKA